MTFHRSCPSTVKKFFEDFDLLPIEYKKIMWDSPYMPDSDDLLILWQLYEESDKNTLSELIRHIHCMKDIIKERDKIENERRKEMAKRRKNSEYYDRSHRYTVYERRKIIHDPKQMRLIERLTGNELEKRLVKRTENKDIIPVREYRTVAVTVTKEEFDNTPPEKQKQQSMIKMLHNAGGKP